MSKKNLTIIIVLLVIVVAGGIFWMLRTPANQSNNSNSSSSSSSSSSNQASAATITYSANGFSPDSITVHAGDTVTLQNTSSQSVQFDSDPHPVHTNDPELNLGAVQPGSSGSFKVMTKGTHGYHNHLNPAQTGTIVVE